MPEKSKAGRGPYPPEVRERAVRMVFDHQSEYPSQWKAIESIAAKLAINHETLRQWVRRAETDAGARPGLTTDERARMKELEKENFELRRANEILKAASAFFAGSSTRDRPDSRLHRRTPPPVRGRADLPGAHRARLQDRPEHLLGGQEAPTVATSRPRRGAQGRDPRGSGATTSRSMGPTRSGPSSTGRASGWRAAPSSA